MSGNPQRQKMINMMYLVLTALLALNVSADILKAFGLVNRGLGNTITGLTSKNDFIMGQFKTLKDNNPKAAEPYDDAIKAQQISATMIAYLGKVKDDIAKEAEGWDYEQYPGEKVTVLKESDLEAPHRYFIEEKKGQNGIDLLAKLKQFNVDMAKLNGGVIAIDTVSLKSTFKEKDGTKKKWAEYYFEGKPSIAAITLLTKFQTDVKASEADALQFNIKRVGATDFKFDQVKPMVSINTPSLNVGGKFEAQISLGAYDSKSSPIVKVGGRVIPVKDGVAIYNETANGMGTKNINGEIVVKSPIAGEKDKVYKFETSYQVFTGGATISADKMNMLYVGLDNPISISAAGFRPDQVNASATGAALVKKGNGAYVIKPLSINTREIVINVAVNDNGTSRQMGKAVYRVRNVPKPEILLGSKQPGPISRGELTIVSQVNAGYGESFAFEGLGINVTSFTFVHAKRAGGTPYFETVTGNRVTGGMRNAFQGAKPGDVIVISEVSTVSAGASKKSNGGSWTVK
ncbi:MAG: gliding motility protein GldM [Bacteroidota bacterium]|nr:gliding motility protein GldM [Bacteroidota bacterium]